MIEFDGVLDRALRVHEDFLLPFELKFASLSFLALNHQELLFTSCQIDLEIKFFIETNLLESLPDEDVHLVEYFCSLFIDLPLFDDVPTVNVVDELSQGIIE